MNSQQKTLRLYACAGRVVVAAACASAVPAHSLVSFTTDRVTRQVFCDMPALKGEFHRNNQSYVASGSCLELEAAQSNDGKKNRSEFDQYNNSKEIWRASWTATGSFDPTTKVTTETITLPAPKVDEFAPQIRRQAVEVERVPALVALEVLLVGVSPHFRDQLIPLSPHGGHVEPVHFLEICGVEAWRKDGVLGGFPRRVVRRDR